MRYPGKKGSKLETLWDCLSQAPRTSKDIVYRLGILNHTKAISRLRSRARAMGGDVIAHQDRVNRNWYTYELTVKD